MNKIQNNYIDELEILIITLLDGKTEFDLFYLDDFDREDSKKAIVTLAKCISGQESENKE